MIRVPEDATRDMLHVCRRLYERGLVAGADGNVSIRFSKDRLLATPTGRSKGFIGAGDLVVCDRQGQQLDGKLRLTTEIKIHLVAYDLRDDVCAVVHAHPPYATAFAVAGEVPSEKSMPEAYIAVGKVALAPYGTPSTEELAETLRPAVREHDAILLANHGAMTLGRDALAAYHRMEALEQLCRITFITRVLGGARQLGAEEMAKLDAIRGIYGTAAPNTPCYHCGWSPGQEDAKPRPGAGREADLPGPTPPRPHGYTDPVVHWPGNPPVWERPGSPPTLEEAQVRDLVRRELRKSGTE
jgi:L-fuculose-phosphate aldolase